MSRAAADTTNVVIRTCLQLLARADAAAKVIANTDTLIRARAFVEGSALAMRAVGEELVAMENEEIKTSSELLEATMQGVVGPKKNWKDKLGDGEVTFSILRKLADKTLLSMKFETDKKLSDVVGLAEDLLVKAKHVAQVHFVELAPGVMDRHAASLKEAKVGVWEAKLLLGAERFEEDSGKLRKFAIKMRPDLWSVCSSLLIYYPNLLCFPTMYRRPLSEHEFFQPAFKHVELLVLFEFGLQISAPTLCTRLLLIGRS